ncbi:MAG: hypothetical protein ABI910_10070 [Gemmatimonadota bacterium]
MPLTTSELAYLGARLLEERTRVPGTMKQYGADLDETQQEAAGDLSTMSYHPADEGTDTFDREFDAQELRRVSGELRDIDDALERLYHTPKSFGRDERSGVEVPFARLN